jgi:hypothetical protein
MTKKAATGGPLGVVTELIEIGNADTVYRDVYLERARAQLGSVLSFEDFRSLEEQQTQLAGLPVMITHALDKPDWPLVKELTGQAQALRQAMEGKRGLIETARGVYAVSDVRLDPFSPGLEPFTRISAKELPALRKQAMERLAGLERVDASWQEFYGGRRAAFQALTVTAPGQAGAVAAASVADAREAALQALKSGDMGGLAKLADTVMAVGTAGKLAGEGPAAASAPAQEGPSTDLFVSYSSSTLAQARELGLAARRLEPRVELASLRRYAWNPLIPDESGRIGIKQLPLPGGTPEALRERLEMFMIHPLVNSGGARYLPTLVAEDVLVEDFPDPKEGEEPPGSELLKILGFQVRRGLPRIAIEQALRAHGVDVLDRVGLDPRAFRVVCIPPDVHLRLGEAEGWGRQPLWTHFDGYLVMADGRLRALAGGDVRFGGLYDLLGLSRDYDSDRVIARFAVVRRERMVAW